MIVQSAMQYKVSLLLTVVGQLLVSFSTFLGIYYMFQRFDSVKGYTYSEVLLCFSVVLLQFSVAEMFGRGFDTFSGIVRQGEFDRILVRPRNEILQVLGSRFELTRIGRMLQALILFVYSIANSCVRWTTARIFTVIFMLFGGIAVFFGLFIIRAAVCFFTLEGLEVMNVFTDGVKEFGKYPVDVYGKRVLFFMTAIIPYALVQYYPLQFLLGRTESAAYVFLPLAALFFPIPCLLLWRYGVRKYQSSGS